MCSVLSIPTHLCVHTYVCSAVLLGSLLPRPLLSAIPFESRRVAAGEGAFSFHVFSSVGRSEVGIILESPHLHFVPSYPAAFCLPAFILIARPALHTPSSFFPFFLVLGAPTGLAFRWVAFERFCIVQLYSTVTSSMCSLFFFLFLYAPLLCQSMTHWWDSPRNPLKKLSAIFILHTSTGVRVRFKNTNSAPTKSATSALAAPLSHFPHLNYRFAQHSRRAHSSRHDSLYHSIPFFSCVVSPHF